MNKNQVDALVLIAGRVASMLVAFVIIRLLTAILSPVEIGRMAILITIIGFFGLFLISPIGNYVNRQIIIWGENGSLTNNLLYYIFYVFLVALFAVVFLSFLRLIFPLAPDVTNLWFAVVIFLGIAISSLYSSFIGYVNLFKKRLAFVVLSNLAGWTGIGLSVLLTLLFVKTAEWWMLGGYITQFIFAIIAWLLLSRLSCQSEDKKHFSLNLSLEKFRGVINFSLPLSVAVLFYWVQTSGYRFVLQSRFGLETLGIFFVNFNIGIQLVLAFESLFNQFYHPIYYNNISSGEVSKRVIAWNEFAAAFMPALLILLFFIACANTILSRILVSPIYWPYSFLIFFGALSESLRILSTIYSLAAHAEYKTKILILPGFVAAFLVIFLFYFIPEWHLYAGLALALILASLCGFFVLRVEVKKIVPISFPLTRIIQAFAFSLPMLVFFWLFPLFSHQLFFWSFLFLVVLGLYLLLGQYLFARRWMGDLK